MIPKHSALLLVLIALAAALPVRDARANKVEDVSFITNVVPNTNCDKPIGVKAKLYLPAAPKHGT
jgi:hypothetical protein